MSFSIRSFLIGTSGACVLLLCSCEAPGPTVYDRPGSEDRYTVTYANGFGGPGYYYGPSNLGFYSQQPGIVYYRTREEVPRRYWVNAATPGYGHPMRAMPPPPSTFTVSLGNGYAGRGYYYGPPGLHYYDRGPGVLYFRTRAEVPGLYWQ
jgi:hypothetical protein